MEKSEDECELNSEEFSKNSNNRDINIIISETNDVLYIKSSLSKDNKIDSIKEIDFNNFNNKSIYNSTIIDISKLIKNKNAKTIRMLALQSINQNIIFNEDDYFETKNNSIKINKTGEAGKDEFDETFGLLERNEIKNYRPNKLSS